MGFDECPLCGLIMANRKRQGSEETQNDSQRLDQGHACFPG